MLNSVWGGRGVELLLRCLGGLEILSSVGGCTLSSLCTRIYMYMRMYMYTYHYETSGQLTCTVYGWLAHSRVDYTLAVCTTTP